MWSLLLFFNVVFITFHFASWWIFVCFLDMLLSDLKISLKAVNICSILLQMFVNYFEKLYIR